MKMWKAPIVAVILTATSLNGYAQDAATKEAIAKYPRENAIMWENSEHVTIKYEDGELVAKSTSHEERLLLNAQTASMYGTGYVFHSYFHPLEKLQAATLVPDGDGYRSIKAKDLKTTHSEGENVFYDDTKETKVTFGSLEQYARTRLDYTTGHRDIHFLPHFYFQGYMPIRQATFSVTFPKSVVIKYILQGNHTDKIHFTKEEGRNDITYTWEATNMPKVHKFDDAPESSWYVPHVLIYVASYKSKNDDSPTPVLSTISDLYRFYYPFIRNINRRKDDSLNSIVASLVKDAPTPRDKAAAIYRWVQQNIRYVAFEDSMGGFIPREAGTVCARRFGDCKDMTSLLVIMCRRAGLQAYYTWIGTRDKPYKFDEVPLPVVSNHMICALKLDNEWVFMDGTDPVIPFGNPPYGIQGKQALIGIDSTNFKLVQVPEIAATKSTITDSTHMQLAGSGLIGDVQISYGGYGAWHMAALMRYRNEGEQEKTMRSLASRGSNKYKQETWSFLPSPASDKTCVLKSRFTLDDYARAAGKEYYVNLNLQRTWEDEYVDKNEREVSIEHSYKNNTKQIVVLDIPKGYHVTYLPPDKEEKVPGLWSYAIHYQKSGSQVKLIKEFTLESLYITPAQFTAHNKLIEGLREQYRESIVLAAN